jgi:polysaccharide biosynthesis transport protein
VRERSSSGLKGAVINAPTGAPRPVSGIRSRPVRNTSPPALNELFFGTRLQIATIAATTAVALLLGLLFLAAASPRYRASALLLIDTQRSRSPLDAPNSVIDSSAVASQIETLKSETLARAVIGKLGLDTDPEFTRRGLISSLVAWIETGATGAPDSQQRRQRTLIERFESALDVFLAGRSYAAVIRFSSADPEKAARIANAICDAYIDDQLEARTAGSTRANQWFQSRLDELKSQADQAERALEEFSKEHPGQSDAARQVRLHDLMTAAQARKLAYESFRSLSGYSRAVEQQTLPTTEARVLTWAEAPLTRSWPPVGLTLLLSAVAGGALGTLIAYAREHLGGRVRSRQSLERDLDLRCLGFFPQLARLWRRKSMRFWRRHSKPRGIVLAGETDPSCAREALIGLRIALNAYRNSSSGAVSLGIVSAHSGEGKTTLAVNLAKSMADAGMRVLLVDADLHGLSLTKELAPEANRGLSEALAGAFALADLEPVPGLGFPVLRQSLDRFYRRPADVLSSRRMREMLDAARSEFDYIVLDLPAVLEHVDACAAANQIDLFLLVAEWGRTKIADLEAVSARCDQIAERIVGVFVNKVQHGAGWY